MIGSSRLALVGAFVLGGVLLFAIGVFIIGDRRLLFADNFEVGADFGNVTGVRIGTKVRVAGFDAGEVIDIGIPPTPSVRFRVVMRVAESLHPLVRADSVAAVLTDGLIGNAFIQIREGSDAAPLVPGGGTISGVDPLQIADLIEEGRATFRTIAEEVLDVKNQVSTTVDSFYETLDTTNLVISDVGNDVRAISSVSALFIDDARAIAETTKAMIDNVQAGRGTIGQLFTDDALYRRAVSISASADETMKSVRAAAGGVERTFTELTAPEGPSQQVLADIRDVLSHTRDAMSDLAENTEALKRNWLFRGFFSDRGFFNLDAMSLAEYQQLGARNGEYAPLRIWLDADVLFAPTDTGELALAPEGRSRLNSAMAQLLQYPRESPLVVEGYSTAAAADERFVEGMARARVAREYLVDRFSRSSTLTGTMPMGDLAPGGPRDDGRWNGIALTLLVRPESLGTTEAGADP